MNVERVVKHVSFLVLFLLHGVGLREFTDVFITLDRNSNGTISSEELREYTIDIFANVALPGRTQTKDEGDMP